MYTMTFHHVQTVAVRAVERGTGVESSEAGPTRGACTTTRVVPSRAGVYPARLHANAAYYTYIMALLL